MQDTAAAVRRLAAHAEAALEVLVERHAVSEQVLDAGACLARHQLGDLLIDDARARADRVGGVILRPVALGDRGGDAALRPEARRAFAEAGGGDDRDRKRRELERGEQAGKPGADNNHAALPRAARKVDGLAGISVMAAAGV